MSEILGLPPVGRDVYKGARGPGDSVREPKLAGWLFKGSCRETLYRVGGYRRGSSVMYPIPNSGPGMEEGSAFLL